MPATPPAVYQLKVTLRGSRPLIWRRILVAAGTSLGELHPILQVVMGWHGAHLHLFQSVDGAIYGDPEEDPDDMMGFVDGFSVLLETVLVREKQRLRYEYDFGDSWEHEIVLEKVLPASSEDRLPRCIKAVGQCPPEDVGGMFGFYQFLDAMADPAHPDHEAIREWWGDGTFDPAFVDLDAINDRLVHCSEIFAGGGDFSPPSAEDFHGLSPDQLDQLLTSPLDCPQVFASGVSKAAMTEEMDSVPVMRMLRGLADALQGKGIKLTPKGNLPLKVVQRLIAAAGEDELATVYRVGYAGVRSEEDVVHVHLTRLLAEMAGFTRKHRGRLLLNQAAAKQIEKGDWPALYQTLLATMMNTLNWAWLDRAEGLEDLQLAGPFGLWLLAIHGDDWRPESFYIDAMLRAFPMLLNQVPAYDFTTPEKQAAGAIKRRMLALYRWFGLLERRPQVTAPLPQGTDLGSVPDTSPYPQGTDRRSVPGTSSHPQGTDLGSVPNISPNSQGTDPRSVPDHFDPDIKRTRLFEHLFRPAGPLRGLS